MALSPRKKLHALIALLACASIPTVTLAVDPNRYISQYGHTAWRIQDGVFSGAPNALAQTADGYIWIGTQSVLVRFEGISFMPWIPGNGKGLRASTGIF